MSTDCSDNDEEVDVNHDLLSFSIDSSEAVNTNPSTLTPEPSLVIDSSGVQAQSRIAVQSTPQQLEEVCINDISPLCV